VGIDSPVARLVSLCSQKTFRVRKKLLHTVRYTWLSIAVLAALSISSPVREANASVTVDDLIARVHIISWSVSPDGESLAFVLLRGDALANEYEVSLKLCAMSACDQPVELANYDLPPEEVYDPMSHVIYRTVSQYVWSRDSKMLLYSAHQGGRMVLRIHELGRNGDRVVLDGTDRIEIDGRSHDGRGFLLRTFSRLKPEEETYDAPRDAALLIRDTYRFYNPLPDPKKNAPLAMETWEYVWGADQAQPIPRTRVLRDWPYPQEWHWNGESISFAPVPPLPPPAVPAGNREVLTEKRPAAIELVLSPTKTIVRTTVGQSAEDIYEEDASLVCQSSEKTDQDRDSYTSDDARVAVLLRSTNLVPDELVRLDLRTHKVTSIFAANKSFEKKTEGIAVRFIPIEIEDRLFFGRLYLPPEGVGEKPYPLVITSYLSTPGFLASVGDELPVLALATNGIAVFSLHARNANTIGTKGDFAPELLRVERPLRAMEWVIKKLAQDGLVAPDRVGVQGLSYGAEIAMYAYWKSPSFRAVSAATASWEPIQYAMGGLPFSAYLRDRGFEDPDQGMEKTWKLLSAGENARPTAPPLLWQSPEWEQTSEIASWLRLRRAGAQVEWLQYPDEGHVKRSPRNLWWVNERNLAWFLFWLKDQEVLGLVPCDEYVRWMEMRRSLELVVTREAAARGVPRDRTP
jgi:Prolyl oligopeptidase family